MAPADYVMRMSLLNPFVSKVKTDTCLTPAQIQRRGERHMKQCDKIEFGISSVQSCGPHAIIEGRCHCGPIKLGDTFTTVSEMTVQMDSLVCGPTTLRSVALVEIKVNLISAYDHQIEELSQSMTAQLDLTGTGIEHLKAGLVLS